MAFGMKQWSALVAVLLTAVVWMAVPPRSLEELPLGWSARRTQPSAAEQHRNRLFEATWRANARLQTHRWADSLRPLVLEHGTRGVLLGLTAPDRPRDEVELLREYLHEEIPPGTAGQAAVGVFFLPAGASGYPGLVTRRLEGYYFGRAEDGTPYCFAARSRSTPGDLRPSLPLGLDQGDQSLTGICRWIHRYGLPAGGVGRWMEGGGATAAAALRPFDGGVVAWSGSDPDDPPDLPRRGLFGIPGGTHAVLRTGRALTWTLTPARDRCLAGDAQACLRMTLDTSIAEGRGFYPANHWRGTAFTTVESWPLWRQASFLMITLEERFGPERFQAFWSSDAPVPQAFEAAFGEPMADWLLDWYGEWVRIDPPGPAPRLADLVGGLAVLLLAGLLASFLVGRWTVVE